MVHANDADMARRRREVEALQARLAAIASAPPDEAVRALQARVVLGEIDQLAGLIDIDGSVLDANDAFLNVGGASPEHVLRRPIWEAPWWSSRATAERELSRLMQAAASGHAARAVIDQATGGVPESQPLEVTIRPVRDATNAVVYFVVEGRAVAAERRARALAAEKARALAESEARFRALAENSSDLVCLHAPDGTYHYLSPSLRFLLGYEPEDLVDTHPRAHVHPEDRERFGAALESITDEPRAVDLTYRVRRRGGDYLWFDTVLTPITDVEGGVVQLQSSSRDVTERKRTEEELVRRAFHDELTGLPNRALLLDRLGQALAVSHRTSQMIGVLFIDLDGFKAINEDVGHQAGDALLVAVAERLRGLVRPGDTLARFGGDEFVMLCAGTDGAVGTGVVARRILRALHEPFLVGDRTVRLSASIGIATSHTTDDPIELVEDADAAMYEAKRDGRSRFVFFDPGEREDALAHLAIESALARAVERGELRLHYQPELDLRTREVKGFEALVRWRREDGSLVPPGDFIPLAEETGLIVPIGRWVIEEACRQAQRWNEVAPDTAEPVKIWVNVSARQLTEPELVPSVEGAISRSGIAPGQLCMELTESALMNDADFTASRLDELRSLGVQIGIDDFGTGYSSLTYLQRFPLDVLKVDRSFVSGLGMDHESTTIVGAIIDLAHNLGLTVIAEGVETEDQLSELERMGCDQAVGYLFSKPRDPAELAEFVPH